MCAECGCPKCRWSGWKNPTKADDGYEETIPCDCNRHWMQDADREAGELFWRRVGGERYAA